MLQFVATKFQKNIHKETVAAGNTVLCAEHGVKMWSLSLVVIHKRCWILHQNQKSFEKWLFKSKKEPQSVWFRCFQSAVVHKLQCFSVLAQSDRPTKRWNFLLVVVVSGFGGGQIQNHSPGRNSKYPVFIIFIILTLWETAFLIIVRWISVTVKSAVQRRNHCLFYSSSNNVSKYESRRVTEWWMNEHGLCSPLFTDLWWRTDRGQRSTGRSAVRIPGPASPPKHAKQIDMRSLFWLSFQCCATLFRHCCLPSGIWSSSVMPWHRVVDSAAEHKEVLSTYPVSLY